MVVFICLCIVIVLFSMRGFSMKRVSKYEEAKKVLDESSLLAEQRLKEQFPELPELNNSSKESTEHERVALTTGGEEIALHEQLYSYLKERDGKLSISQCSSLLEVNPEDIKKAIKYLEKTGKVVID